MAGLIIAIDGPDGVGKTTQHKLLTEYLNKQGHRVHTTRHNGGTPIGEALREVSLAPIKRSAETDLYISLAMGQALSEDLEQRQSAGEVILIDRSPLAIVAYQGYGSQLKDRQAAFDACERLFKNERIDLLLFLNAPQDIINDRRDKRATTDYFESQGDAFHNRVREGYEAGLDALQKTADFKTKIVEIDASSDIETIQRAIIQALPPDITT